MFRGTPVLHSARWGKASLAVCLAIQQSARERRARLVEHQIPVQEGVAHANAT